MPLRASAHAAIPKTGVDEAGDGVSEFCFFVANAVAADDGASGFHHFGKAACEDALEDCEVGFLGKANQGEGSERASAHGVNIAESIGGCDLSEGVRIVHDRGEEVHRLDERRLGRELIHAGVVGMIKAD